MNAINGASQAIRALGTKAFKTPNPYAALNFINNNNQKAIIYLHMYASNEIE